MYVLSVQICINFVIQTVMCLREMKIMSAIIKETSYKYLLTICWVA